LAEQNASSPQVHGVSAANDASCVPGAKHAAQPMMQSIALRRATATALFLRESVDRQ
jgi:hypothetical protein